MTPADEAVLATLTARFGAAEARLRLARIESARRRRARGDVPDCCVCGVWVWWRTEEGRRVAFLDDGRAHGHGDR